MAAKVRHPGAGHGGYDDAEHDGNAGVDDSFFEHEPAPVRAKSRTRFAPLWLVALLGVLYICRHALYDLWTGVSSLPAGLWSVNGSLVIGARKPFHVKFVDP
jgi:hypothetical protein